MQYNTGKTFFFITTNGHSASKWLAKTLNMHKDIICSHSSANTSIAMVHDREYSDDELKQIMADETRKQIPVDILLNELEEIGKVPCYGNVHLFNLRQLKENTQRNKPIKRFCVVDLVRHPVSLVHSGTYNMIRQARYNIDRANYLKNIYYRNKKLYDDFASIHKIDLNNLDILAFMANVMTLKSLATNMLIQDVDRQITMEAITTSREEYKKLVNIISEGKVEADDHYLNAVFGVGAVNIHKPKKKFNGVKAIYNSWSKWRKEFFNLLVESTGIDKHYAIFEYDFSFLEKTQ